MKKIKILLTYDYELPLGSAKNYDQALFHPAAALLSLANDIQVPLVMFADVCSAIRFKDWDYNGYYKPFKEQLQASLQQGHDVQLHIHPHWMNSTFQKGTFIPSSNFSLSGFSAEIQGYTIEKIIQEAFSEMVQICREIDSKYQCIAFRAGGYDVEPESKRILNKLYDLGVRIESSVIQDFYLNYSFSQIDYSLAPDLSHWFIDKNGPLIKQGKDLLELPITSKPVTFPEIVMRRIRKTINKELYKSRLFNNSGKGFAAIHDERSLKDKYKSLMNPTVLTFDREYRTLADLENIVSYNVKRYQNEENDLYLTAIAHPKSMGVYHLQLMRDFVDRLRSLYKEQVSFITYREVYSDFNL